MSDSALNWRLTACLAGGILACVPLLKMTGVWIARRKITDRSAFYLLAPVWSKERLARAMPASREAGRRIIAHASFAAVLVVTYYLFFWNYLAPLRLPVPVLGYCAIPAMVGLAEVLGSLLQLVFLPSGRVVPSLQREPWKAKSVSDFWGTRWNRWIGDFFREVLFRPLRWAPWLGVGVVFVFSGLLHEVLIDWPLYALTGKNLFGTQFLYFLLQGAAVAVDHFIPGKRRMARRAFAWLAVVGPAPLMCNEGVVRMVHLWTR